MKKPWLIAAGLCSVALAIVLFCVIFGSYTSMLRSKNRINAGKDLMVAACMDQLDLVPELVSKSPENIPGPKISQIKENVTQIQAILTRFQASDAPLAPDLVAAFEDTQARLAKDMDSLTAAIGKTHPLSTKMEDLYLKTIYSARRYNKEAAYFKRRKSIFPGFLTARWFNIDHLDFPLIDLTCFAPWGLK
ncbi:MAG: hypothetical protein K9K40_10945 [Desulfotignum sp.]|nr:hypothetical protein [Desulfotignum sp.]MCF8125831.1 hypothetical protein [Desulfotignum sp.]